MNIEINDFVKTIAARTHDQSFKAFIYRLYSDTPIEELTTLDEEFLYASAVKTFEIFKNRTSNARKVEITHLEENSEWCILQVIGQEIPFLVESIGNELKLQDIEIKLILHPVIPVERDTDGKLLEISEGGAKESMMQFYIPNWLGYEYYSNLISRINTIVKCVELAVADWDAMKKKVAISEDYVSAYQFPKEEIKQEYLDFLKWIIEKNFILLGSFILKREADNEFNLVKGSELGICKDVLYKSTPIIFDDQEDEVIIVAKSDSKSVVHRTDYMNCICIKKFDAQGVCNEKLVFLGFFTSATYYQSVRSIPFIKMKVNNILARYGQDEASYNAKELVTALEAFPRSDLFQINEDILYEMLTGIVSLSLTPRVKAFARLDQGKKFISFILFIPKKSSGAQSIRIVERIIEQQLHGVISRRYVTVSDSQLTRIQFLVKLHPGATLEYNLRKIEELILGAISMWQDELFKALCAKYSRNEATIQYQKYKDAFDIKYTSNFVAQQAVHDIKMIEGALLEQGVKFSFYISAKSGKELVQLKIFSPSALLPLSSTLPIIENIGFLAVDMLTFKTQIKVLGEEQEIFIDYFRLEPKNKNFKAVYTEIKSEIETALEKICRGALENDEFNALLSYAKMTWREVSMLRAYAKYLKQINFVYAPSVIACTLAHNADITSKLVELFHYKFDSSSANSEQEQIHLDKIQSFKDDILEALLSVPNITEDRVLRMYLHVILATKRTNYFQVYNRQDGSDYISFKIASEEIHDMPLPRPFREIWVYSPRFEAIHLRGGKVARGGIRWSDRPEDFRTEILGLMKAQMIKNSVIVPVGSKGGFVVKSLTPAAGRDAFFEEGVQCYKQFLSGILDITDNILEDHVMTPKGIIRYDEEDPYLVVAADKGTATFSDYANAVSKGYNFWLDDAFASGGSAGYDHKKMAITARGAWISVERHFMELGINIKEQTFSVLGIGDMSGDVFGNGMLLSDKIKLVMAFNHSHIFLDPNPDTAASFKERKRLFDLPRSQWSDYDRTLISQGGGIFQRSMKSIPLSQEIRNIFNITDTAMSPDDLLNAALKAPIDLIWNGGIGTYVKAKNETHEMIGDKSNDSLRVNGHELRCRVFAEGGNLGCTQLGRIEYARNGGKINSDAIDNSAGVDCSDHEVNIKIGFSKLLQNRTIKIEERDRLLSEMTGEVAELVLRDNHKQVQLISLEEASGAQKFEEHVALMQYLELQGELDRNIEKLPSNEEVVSIGQKYGGLSRPEISVLIAYAKTSAIKHLAPYDLCSDPHLLKYLIQYFPKLIQEQYKEAFLEHKLKNEILHTVLINDFVNMLGCCFFHQLMSDNMYTPENIIKAFVVVCDSLEITKIWHDIEQMSNILPFSAQIALFVTVQKVVMAGVLWILKHCHSINDVASLITSYKSAIVDLKKLNTDSESSNQDTGCIIESMKQSLDESIIPQDIWNNILELHTLSNIFDISHIAGAAKSNIHDASVEYFALSDELSIFLLLERIQNAKPKQYVDAVALRSLSDEICAARLTLTINQLRSNKKSYDTQTLAKYLGSIDKVLKMTDDSLLAMLIVIVKQLHEFLEIREVSKLY